MSSLNIGSYWNPECVLDPKWSSIAHKKGTGQCKPRGTPIWIGTVGN